MELARKTIELHEICGSTSGSSNGRAPGVAALKSHQQSSRQETPSLRALLSKCDAAKPRRGGWTQERKDQVTALWNIHGLTAGQIVGRVGGTRNSIIGFLYRAGLLGRRGKGKHPNGQCPSTTNANRKRKGFSFRGNNLPKPPETPLPPDALVHLSPQVSLLELEPHHCKAVLCGGDYSTKRYCGRKATHKSWCEAHASVLYEKRRGE